MRAAARRLLQGLLLAAIPVAFLALVWPVALRLPNFWLAIAVGLLGNTLQPSYRPFEGARTRHDRGTAAQILWTVYGVQAATVLELALRRPALAMDAISWAAFAAMVLGLAVRTWAVATLGRWFTWNVDVQSGQRTAEHGPYRFVRHPGYAGALLTYVAVCVLFHCWVAALLALVALPAAFLRRIAYEEALLRRTLPGYAPYASRTAALLPTLRSRRARETANHP
jgi:protein-S-isoprenylcysteine O-methyltransferase